MVIISYGPLRAFIEKHPRSKDALNNWFRLASKANWSNFHEMKEMFNSVDAVGNDHYVFNIRGNNYRLVAMIFFDKRTIYVRFVGTHEQYDNVDPQNI